MTQVISSSVPLTTIDALFLTTHELFDQYRTSIFAFAGTGKFFYRFCIIVKDDLSSDDCLVI